MITAFNPFNVALEQSAYRLGQQDRAELSRATTELINCYQGNQLGYLWGYLAKHIKSRELRQRYQTLAIFHNITRLLVDRVSTLGEVPVRVLWRRKNGSPHTTAQRKWDEITSTRMGDVTWDAFIPSLARRRELTKTVVAAVEWDAARNELLLNSYSPNVIDVGYDEGNYRKDRPDWYTLLRDEASGVLQKWDFSGGAARVYDVDSRGAADGESEGYPVEDPETGRPLVPFVAFRTDVPSDGFFVWDGQAELLAAQEFVNRCYTQLAIQLHYGAFKVPIVRGEWIGKDGQPPQITLDPSEFLQEPYDPMSNDNGPKIRWDGPSAKEEIDALLEVIGHWVEATAATFHLNPSAIRAKNEATSGYALQIESAALKVKHQLTRTLSLAPLRRLVHVMRTVWNYYQPDDKLPDDAQFEVVIPDYGSAVTLREEVDADVLMLDKGIKTLRQLILKHNPGISNEEVERMLADGPGVADEIEAGEPVEPEEPETEDAPDLPADALIEPTSNAAQDAALNGAQMASLLQIVQAVSDKTLPYDSAIALVRIAVPSVDDATAIRLLGPADGFEPPAVQAATPNFPPPVAAEQPPAVPEEE